MRMQDRIVCVQDDDYDFYVVLTPEIAVEMVKCFSVDGMCDMALNECEPAQITNTNQVNIYIERDCDDETAAEIRQSVQTVADLYVPPKPPTPVRQADMFNQVVTLESGRSVEFWVNKKTGLVQVDVFAGDLTKAGQSMANFNANELGLD